MIYLLTLGWPWFAGACALGALVGFLTFSQAKNATFSGGWIVLLGVVALGAGAAVSYMELLEGREAAMFDIGLLASAAYALGLPLGGVIKSMMGAPAQESSRAKSTLVVVSRPKPAAATPSYAPSPAADVEPIEAPPLAPVMAAEAFKAAPEAIATEKPTKKSPAGVAPPTLAAPRGGAPDNLARIKGLGPKSVEKLHALGIYHYDQIAAWDEAAARWVGEAIGAAGRVERGDWVRQARALAVKTGALESA